MQYDIIIIGAGPGGIFSAYELLRCLKKDIRLKRENVQLMERKSNPASIVNHVPS